MLFSSNNKIDITKKNDPNVVIGVIYVVALSFELALVYIKPLNKHHKNQKTLQNYCLFQKVNTLHGHGQTSGHLSPQRVSPYVNISSSFGYTHES